VALRGGHIALLRSGVVWRRREVAARFRAVAALLRDPAAPRYKVAAICCNLAALRRKVVARRRKVLAFRRDRGARCSNLVALRCKVVAAGAGFPSGAPSPRESLPAKPCCGAGRENLIGVELRVTSHEWPASPRRLAGRISAMTRPGIDA